MVSKRIQQSTDFGNIGGMDRNHNKCGDYECTMRPVITLFLISFQSCSSACRIGVKSYVKEIVLQSKKNKSDDIRALRT